MHVLFVKMKKIISYILSTLTTLSLTYAHNGEEEVFSGGINPFEYFSHGYDFYGILIIGLWLLIAWGIYTLTLMVIGKHIKIKKK